MELNDIDSNTDVFNRTGGQLPELTQQFLYTVLAENQSGIKQIFGNESVQLNNIKLKTIDALSFKNTDPIDLINFGFCASPFGTAFIATTEHGICQLSFPGNSDNSTALNRLTHNWSGVRLVENEPVIASLAETIFDSEQCYSELTLLVSGTAFQMEVWQALLKIPKGQVWSYQQVAQHIERPKAVRAVANAIGANPIAFLIPCHRVIRNHGGLGGYHWGLDVKQRILASEISVPEKGKE